MLRAVPSRTLQGKPVARRGRKARGLTQTARPPTQPENRRRTCLRATVGVPVGVLGGSPAGTPAVGSRSVSGRTFHSVDPRSGEPGPAFVEATPEDVHAAVAAAAGAFAAPALRDDGRRAELLGD